MTKAEYGVQSRIMSLVEREAARGVGSQIAGTVFEQVSRLYGMRLSAESNFHLQQASLSLLSGPLVLYINHVETGDALIMIPLVMSLPGVKRIMGPVGMKHYDYMRDPVGAMAFRLLKFANIYPSPIVQADDLSSYSPQDRARMSSNLRETTSALLWKPGTLYGIAPEGTRSGGVLKRAHRGIGYLNRNIAHPVELTYMPVGLVYPHMSVQQGIRVGKPFTLRGLIPAQAALSDNPRDRAQQTTDILMLKLADLLPLQYRGVYANTAEYLDQLRISASDIDLHGVYWD